MGKVLIEKLLPSLQKMPLPDNSEVTSRGRQTYEIGLDKVDEYKGDLKTLVAALRIFQTCGSQPFVFAGIAYTLVMASREPDDSYAQNGLDAAMEWLEKAQELAPNIVAINMIEAFVYVYSRRFDDARLILDYLNAIEPRNLNLMRAEIAYWQGMGQLIEAVNRYHKAINEADTVPRKLRLRNQLADCYLQFGEEDKALEIYKESAHFSNEDPWLWHNMSIAYYNKGEYKEAAHFNKLALSILDFPEGKEMAQAIKGRLGTGGLVNRLLGR